MRRSRTSIHSPNSPVRIVGVGALTEEEKRQAAALFFQGNSSPSLG